MELDRIKSISYIIMLASLWFDSAISYIKVCSAMWSVESCKQPIGTQHKLWSWPTRFMQLTWELIHMFGWLLEIPFKEVEDMNSLETWELSSCRNSCNSLASYNSYVDSTSYDHGLLDSWKPVLSHHSWIGWAKNIKTCISCNDKKITKIKALKVWVGMIIWSPFFTHIQQTFPSP